MTASNFTIRVGDQHVPINDIVQFWAEHNVSEARGEGQGVGGDRQEDGGTDTCVCPECGATTEHERGTPCAEVACPKCGTAMTGAESAEAAEVEDAQFAESASGGALDLLSEGQTDAAVSVNGPMVMRVKLIEPGWGKGKGNHYYSREVLKRDAHIFDGAKMYESDHKNDKSTRTWVSTVRRVTGFSESGAPIADVVIHNPDFAQRARNLKEAGMLQELPASILATGKTRKGEVGGKKGNIVEAFTDAISVDWVTKAGAGGKALDIISEAAVDDKTEDIVMAENVQEEAIEEVVQEVKEEEKPVATLSIMRAAAMLTESELPAVAIERLAEGNYQDEAALSEAIDAEKKYLEAAGVKLGEAKQEPKPKVKAAIAENVVSGNSGAAVLKEADATPDYTRQNEILGYRPNQS